MKNNFKKIRENYRPISDSNLDMLGATELATIFVEKGFLTGWSIDSTRQAIIRAEKGSRPDISLIKAYCSFFNTTCDYLFGIRDVQQQEENIAMIGKVTNLSGDAISCLKNFSSEDVIIVNTLIEKGYIKVLADIISRYYNSLGRKVSDKDFSDEEADGIYEHVRNERLKKALIPLIWEEAIYNNFMPKAQLNFIDDIINALKDSDYSFDALDEEKIKELKKNIIDENSSKIHKNALNKQKKQ